MKKHSRRGELSAGAKKLKKWRLNNKLSLRSFASLVSVSDVAVLDWETGISRPDSHMRDIIRVVTNGSVELGDWLFDDEIERVRNAVPFIPEQPAAPTEAA